MCCSPVSQSGPRSRPGASDLRSEAGCAKPRLPSLESLPSFCIGCGSKAPNSNGHQRRLLISLHSRTTEFPPTSGRQRPCRDAGVGAIAPGFAMLERAKRASHIDPPASPYAIMRRARPYRGENPGPARMFTESLTPGPELENPRPGIREQPGSYADLTPSPWLGPLHPSKQTCAGPFGKSALCRFCSLIPGLGVKLSANILAGPTVLSAVGACPPHDGVRRRWWINVASAVSLIESSQKIGRSHHRHRPGRDIFSRCPRGSPLRLASLIPQAFSADHFGTRVSSTPAASKR
jgi:hypothetical protein